MVEDKAPRQTEQAEPVLDDSAQATEPELAKLVPASAVPEPEVATWQLADFFEEKVKEQKEISDRVYQKIHREVEPQIQQQAELLKKDAYDTAYNKGYEEGKQLGLEEGRAQGEAEARDEVFAKLNPKIEQFEALLTSFKKPYDAIEEKLYGEMVDFSLHIAQAVLRKSVSEHKDWLIETVREAVAQLPESEGKVEVYLHPDDLAFLQIAKPNISEKWQLHESQTMQAGTCLVKQDYSSVMNSWIARFDEIADQVSAETMLQKSEVEEDIPVENVPELEVLSPTQDSEAESTESSKSDSAQQ